MATTASNLDTLNTTSPGPGFYDLFAALNKAQELTSPATTNKILTLPVGKISQQNLKEIRQQLKKPANSQQFSRRRSHDVHPSDLDSEEKIEAMGLLIQSNIAESLKGYPKFGSVSETSVRSDHRSGNIANLETTGNKFVDMAQQTLHGVNLFDLVQQINSYQPDYAGDPMDYKLRQDDQIAKPEMSLAELLAKYKGFKQPPTKIKSSDPQLPNLQFNSLDSFNLPTDPFKPELYSINPAGSLMEPSGTPDQLYAQHHNRDIIRPGPEPSFKVQLEKPVLVDTFKPSTPAYTRTLPEYLPFLPEETTRNIGAEQSFSGAGRSFSGAGQSFSDLFGSTLSSPKPVNIDINFGNLVGSENLNIGNPGMQNLFNFMNPGDRQKHFNHPGIEPNNFVNSDAKNAEHMNFLNPRTQTTSLVNGIVQTTEFQGSRADPRNDIISGPEDFSNPGPQPGPISGQGPRFVSSGSDSGLVMQPLTGVISGLQNMAQVAESSGGHGNQLLQHMQPYPRGTVHDVHTHGHTNNQGTRR